MVSPSSFFTLLRFTHVGMRLVHILRRLRFGSVVQPFFQSLDLGNTAPTIDPAEGFLSYRLKDSEVVMQAVQHAAKEFPRGEDRSKRRKSGVISIEHVDIDHPRHAPIRNLALHPEILTPVARYLESVPVLLSAMVWHAPNIPQEIKASQLFHFDREDIRQIKCFIPIDSIDADTGPLCLLNATDSRRFIWRSWTSGKLPTSKRRFRDNEVYRVVPPQRLRRLWGAPEDILLVDTTNCLHYGSRPSKRGKYHITLHYVSPYSQRVAVRKIRDLSSAADLAELAAMFRTIAVPGGRPGYEE